ncbi:MAG TPA: RNA polymerase sigma factor [Candidatus Polarisedimenticolia bacterium]|nr:RNA polymerase sigma factor [Candidatus Polarisedimenticolia bacterium]
MADIDPTQQRAADRRRIRDYLRGEARAVAEVEGWIQDVLRPCYPSLLEDREDTAQFVHQKLLSNLRSGKFLFRSSLRTYVSRITHHTAIDGLRRRFRDAPLEAAPADSLLDERSPYLVLETSDESTLRSLALQRSSAPCRSLWRMIFLENLSYEEVGARLGIPGGTVKSRVWHCRRRLLELLEALRHARGRRG